MLPSHSLNQAAHTKISKLLQSKFKVKPPSAKTAKPSTVVKGGSVVATSTSKPRSQKHVRSVNTVVLEPLDSFTSQTSTVPFSVHDADVASSQVVDNSAKPVVPLETCQSRSSSHGQLSSQDTSARQSDQLPGITKRVKEAIKLLFEQLDTILFAHDDASVEKIMNRYSDKSNEDVLTKADKWLVAIDDEFDSHADNGTWDVEPIFIDVKDAEKLKLLIRTKWVFSIKSSDVYKARLVARGDQQDESSLSDVFSPTLRAELARAILATTAAKSWYSQQYYFKTAYLNSDLHSELYINPLDGYDAPKAPAVKSISLSQKSYIEKFVKEFNLDVHRHYPTPLALGLYFDIAAHPLEATEAILKLHIKRFRQLVGALLYASCMETS
ncbi:unnamed protein product [Ambrosiozyma monospora]|uniref:Unnamed protein product n=1 Tax=Ambrosiozyma monospora TaxID=43982 RepID=A0ACB5SSE7_AMBMO|nr:unnamed protein product [Ambrosiozyma monospora]